MLAARSLGAVCVAVICSLGCQPAPSQEPHMFHEVNKFQEEKRELGIKGEEFTTEKVLASLGEPEKRLGISEFEQLLKARAVGDPKFVEDTMAHVYHHYSLELPRPMPRGTWRESEGFKKLQIWLYRWKDPENVTLWTSRWFWFAEGHTFKFSYFYLVEDAHVIACDHISRTDL